MHGFLNVIVDILVVVFLELKLNRYRQGKT